MIFDRIMLPAQGRNEDYKFAQTGSVRFVGGAGGAGGAESTPSWLENVIKLDPESGFLSVDDWHVKGDLVIEGQVNQWLAQQLVVNDARIQVNRKQDGVVVDSGLVIYDNDTNSEVSSLLYDISGVWKAGGSRLFTEDYNPKLGGYSAADYPRKAENAVISGKWEHRVNGEALRLRQATSSQPLFIRGVDNTGANLWYVGRNSGSSENVGFMNYKNADLVFGTNSAIRAIITGSGDLSSPSYVSGFAGSGWRLAGGDETHLTIDRLTVRGRMDVYELVVNQIRGTNGALWVSDSAKVASVSGNRLTIDTGGSTSFVPFVVNDLLRCQRWTGKNVKYYVVRVTAVGSNYIDVALVAGSSPREAGDYLVRMGNTSVGDRQGALYLTSSDSNAPYMDVLDGVNSASFANKTKVRIGKLDGIVDSDLGTLSGYGLYTQNGFFKGKVTVTGGNAATKEDINNIEIGGRNYALGTATPKIKNSWTGANNQRLTLYTVNVSPEWEVGKQVTIAFDVEVSGLAWSGGTSRLAVQSQGNVTSFDGFGYKRFFSGSGISGSGKSLKTRIVHKATLTAAHLTNQTYAFEVRCDYITAGSLSIKNFALFYGNKATDWTPAPEDVPSALDYLAEAMQGSTEIEGGIINTNVLMVKDTNGKVTGGMSGLKSDNVGFWSGGNYQDAVNNNVNVIFRKDGSFSLSGGKIRGTSAGTLSIDGGVVTGMIESQNWDGENGSRLNLMDGSLEFGNTIKVDSFSKEIIVKDGDTQNTGVRIGDFLLSPTTGGAGALDVDLSGSRTLPAFPAYSPQDPPFLLREDLMTYINSSGVIGSSSVIVSTNLTAGNKYTFQTSINARITRGDVLDTATDPLGAPSTIINSISRGGVFPWITVSLFSGTTKVGERNFSIIEKSDLGIATFSDQTLDINIPFTAASNSLRVEITQSGEVVWKVRYPASQGNLVEFRNAGLIYSELDSSSRVRIIPSAAINELSAKGFLSLWGPEKYFRIYDRAGVTNFIEARGTQVYMSPNGVHRLRVTDSGIQKSSNSGVSWTSL